MDFVMPNMDGPTAAKEIRKLGYEGIILGVTGNALDSDVRHFIENGATAVLPKPLNIDDFNSSMANLRAAQLKLQSIPIHSA